MRANAYQNKKQKGTSDFSITLSMTKDEADTFVARDKASVSGAIKAVKAAVSAGPKSRASSDE